MAALGSVRPGRFPHRGLLRQLYRLLPTTPGMPRQSSRQQRRLCQSDGARAGPTYRHSVRPIREPGHQSPTSTSALLLHAPCKSLIEQLCWLNGEPSVMQIFSRAQS